MLSKITEKQNICFMIILIIFTGCDSSLESTTKTYSYQVREKETSVAGKGSFVNQTVNSTWGIKQGPVTENFGRQFERSGDLWGTMLKEPDSFNMFQRKEMHLNLDQADIYFKDELVYQENLLNEDFDE